MFFNGFHVFQFFHVFQLFSFFNIPYDFQSYDFTSFTFSMISQNQWQHWMRSGGKPGGRTNYSTPTPIWWTVVSKNIFFNFLNRQKNKKNIES
jgi:hypothetical protein